MKIHEIYMKRALELGRRGTISAHPNPSVGCVIVHRNRIIGEGFTSSFGKDHAEINALNSVKSVDKAFLPDSTLYVTLEPCSHYGKTPPCAIRIAEEQPATVIIGCKDPNPKVSGKGVGILKKAGINVKVGVLQDQCLYHHRVFLKGIQTQTPYVTLKWAESADGFIAPLPTQDGEEKIFWLSDSWSQQHAHLLRANHAAILIGTETLKKDLPTLTTRHVSGPSPKPFVLTRDHRNIQETGNAYNVIEIRDEKRKQHFLNTKHSHLIQATSLKEALHKLYSMGYTSVLVEGGSKVIQSFIEEDLWDEMICFKSPNELKVGLKGPNPPKLERLSKSNKDEIFGLRHSSLHP